MPENIELSYVWDHTIFQILLHDINSLLKYTDDDFTPTGKLCYINENGEKFHRKLMKEFFNLRWFTQHLIDEYEYQYGDNEWTNPVHESNWIYRTNKQLMKYVNFTLKEMTPEQLKQKPFVEIFKNQHEKVDTDERESTAFKRNSPHLKN